MDQWLTQWLSQWKPTDFSLTTLIAASFVMFWLKVWPWLTKEYFPARREAERLRLELAEKRDERDANILKDLSTTMVEIKTLVHQNTLSNNPIVQAILERLPMAPTPRNPRNNQKAA